MDTATGKIGIDAAVNTSSPRFFLPAVGLTLLFAALGPAIGGALFIPLAFLLEAPPEAAAVAHIGVIATLVGHALALIPAYILGLFPAAVTGYGYALWDAWAPPRAPRALAAAAIGGAMAYAPYAWLASLGAFIETSVATHARPTAGRWIEMVFTGEFDEALRRALTASGAAAGLVCAMAAGLLGLTPSWRRDAARSDYQVTR